MWNLINVTDNVKFGNCYWQCKIWKMLLAMLNLINVTDNVKFDKCYWQC